MVWCSNCAQNCARPGFSDGFLCCSLCGKVIDQDNFSTEATFVKNAAGQSQLAGNFVRTIQSNYSASRQRTLDEARHNMKFLTTNLRMDDDDSILGPAVAFYTIALERNFTRGRKKELVGAACLYIACRENKKPYLLIDFSDELRTNVYVLGAVFLQLCKLLSLEEHPIVQKPVDPSLFIDRFCERLLGERNFEVSRTALRIIASMKRDWIQTGRKPSGLCGAALYISALSYGLKCSKSEVVKVVHICEATLTKRLIEFENTESGSLTIEEFNKKAKELEAEINMRKEPSISSKASGISELLCEHKNDGRANYAHGLCESCYDDFMKLSGGLEGGAEPPAFQRAEKERMMKELSDKNATEPGSVLIDVDISVPGGEGNERLQAGGPETAPSAATQHKIGHDVFDGAYSADDGNPKVCEDTESLSDIDDLEVVGYLHNEEEKRYKQIIWEEMNREYLEEQAAKEAAAAAAKKAVDANFSNCPEKIQAAQKAATTALKGRKENHRKPAADAKNTTPAQSAAEATRQMLTKKRLSSKINYDVLEKLFDESVGPDKHKKSRSESGYEGKKELESEDTCKTDISEEVVYEENEDTGAGIAYGDEMDYGNIEEGYDYKDNYGYDDY